MNWILALVAFAGLMTILSTVVTITVEAVHKAFSMRKTGLQEMLRALHDNVIEELESGGRPNRNILKNNGGSKKAAAFANIMTRSPSFGGGRRWWWPSNWHINLFQRGFERLTRRQFAEQLAHTEFGEKLAHRDRAAIRRVLAHTSYEFDRYGVAQSQFFRRRAKVISGFIAFSFVALGNVNAIDIYTHLATDEVALGRTLRLVDNNYLAEVSERTELAASNGDALEARAAIATAIRDIEGGTGLPIGRNYFPYCAQPGLDPDQCLRDDYSGYTLAFTQWDVPEPIGRLWHAKTDAIVWVLSLIATAGLLGLGAPFWFDLFSRTAAMTGGAMARRAQIQATPTDRARVAVKNGVRGSEEPEIEEMTDAFLVSAGQVDVPCPVSLPIGARLGPASREATGLGDLVHTARVDGASPAAPAPPAGIRKVHGDWSGRRG